LLSQINISLMRLVYLMAPLSLHNSKKVKAASAAVH